MAIRLGEITTLTLAAPKKASLRTTVPMAVVNQFKLAAGDKLDWSFDIKDGRIIIIIKSIKTQETT